MVDNVKGLGKLTKDGSYKIRIHLVGNLSTMVKLGVILGEQ